MHRKTPARIEPRRYAVAAAAALCVLAFMTACGSSNSSDSSDSSGTNGAKESVSPVTSTPPDELEPAAAEGIMSHGGPERWTGADTSPPPAEGKTVGFMPCALVLPICQYLADEFKDAAATIGFDAKVIDGGSDPTKEQAAVDIALNQGIDCLITAAAPVSDIAPQAAKLREDKIPIVEAFAGDTGDVVVGISQQSAGAALGAYVLNHGGGDIIVTSFAGVPQAALRTQGFTDYIKRFGAGKAKVVAHQDFTVSQIGPGQEAASRSLIQRFPDAEWFYAGADAGLYTPMEIAKQEGSDIKGLGYDGDTGVYAQIRAGNGKGPGAVATISWGLDWVVWSSVDACNRAMQGEKADVNEDAPIVLTDSSNVPAEGGHPPIFDFRGKFKELWGVN